MIDNYLTVLEESLHKKIEVLDRIEGFNKEQEQILKQTDLSMESFDNSIDEKGKLIDELNKLDNGFEQLYERIRQQLTDNVDTYSKQIKKLQELIEKVTEKSITIQTQEARNKQLVESYFSKTRNEIGKNRINSKAALDYYKNMNHSNYVAPKFVDKKK